ncbi:MAG: divalent metal cation transporter [Pirellulales bacterium]
MADESSKVKSERQMLADAREQGTMATLGAYCRLSGPGWLQSAITLGGGSMASSLFLGIIGGYELLWVQPLAMMLGIVMLSAIGYVTVSTGDRPFRAINEHVNPVLGWGWALAVAAANVVWCLPQYALADGVLSQNLLPKLLGEEGWVNTKAAGLFRDNSYWATHCDELVVAVTILIIATFVTWSYDRGGWGLKLYETMLKCIVVAIVLCFIAVVVRVSFPSNFTHVVTSESVYYSDGPQQGRPPDGKFVAGTSVKKLNEESGYWLVEDENGTKGYVAAEFVQPTEHRTLEWGKVFSGFVPNFKKFNQPADSLNPLLNEIEGGAVRRYWTAQIVDTQQDQIVSAAATAVGINMTFLFAYSLLRKRWTKEFRGLIRFDLATAMLIPYLLATSCVVIAAASQFHARSFAVAPDGTYEVPKDFVEPFGKLMEARQKARADAREQLLLAAKSRWENEQEAKQITAQFEARLLGIARNTRPVDDPSAETTNPEYQAVGEQLGLSASDTARIAEIMLPTGLPEMKVASTLLQRESKHLSKSLEPAIGPFFANYVFGFGVLAMTLSTITILMLISGFVFCEMLGLPSGGWPHRLGTLVAGIGGAFGPFLWSQASFYLAVPTSVFGLILLPLAYLTFFLLMNQKSYLGENAPSGLRRLVWNLLMAVSVSVATIGSVFMTHKKAGVTGVGAIVLLMALVILVHFNQVNRRKYDQPELGVQKKNKQ